MYVDGWGKCMDDSRVLGVLDVGARSALNLGKQLMAYGDLSVRGREKRWLRDKAWAWGGGQFLQYLYTHSESIRADLRAARYASSQRHVAVEAGRRWRQLSFEDKQRFVDDAGLPDGWFNALHQEEVPAAPGQQGDEAELLYHGMRVHEEMETEAEVCSGLTHYVQ